MFHSYNPKLWCYNLLGFIDSANVIPDSAATSTGTIKKYGFEIYMSSPNITLPQKYFTREHLFQLNEQTMAIAFLREKIKTIQCKNNKSKTL